MKCKKEERMSESPYGRYIIDDYTLIPIKDTIKDKWSFWLSKVGYTLSLYCFSISGINKTEYQYQLSAIQSYIKLFDDKTRNKTCNNYLVRRNAYKSLSFDDYCECISSIMVEMGYYLTPFIQQMHCKLKNISSDKEKILYITIELKRKMRLIGNHITYKEEDGTMVETTDFNICNIGNCYTFSGIVTRS